MGARVRSGRIPRPGFRFNVAEVFRWYRTIEPGGRHERSKRKQIAPAAGQKAGEFDEDEALFAGTEQTPALERWRLAKAKHAELDFEVKCGTLIPLQTAVSEFSQIASRWRMCGERLAREYGPDAQRIVNEAIAESIDQVIVRYRNVEVPVADDGDVAGADEGSGDGAGSPSDQPMGGGRDRSPDRGQAGAIPPPQPSSEPDLVWELDSNRWWRTAVVAPTQNGKTLMGYVIPVLYHLFELKETVIIGLPDMRMASDKWEREFLPVIEASRYAELFPGQGDRRQGEGSRGGKITSAVHFLHGPMLRFMSAGGSDKSRAGFAGCRVVAITETDGMDEAGEESREANKCKQIEARTRGYDESKRRCYMECTASFPEGKIWAEYSQSTKSRLVRPCPYCHAWVCPEREHLKGWQDAVDEEDAREKSAWHCPECDRAWTQADREEGWEQLRLVHDGQEVTPEGEVVGKPPRVRTLGFRWGAMDNPFTTAGTCGFEEWKGAKSKDRENSEKKILQFTNARPYEAPDTIVEELDLEDIESKEIQYKRGIVPPNCIGLALAVDTHARILYWEGKAVC